MSWYDVRLTAAFSDGLLCRTATLETPFVEGPAYAWRSITFRPR
jgi:hypothetical protein